MTFQHVWDKHVPVCAYVRMSVCVNECMCAEFTKSLVKVRIALPRTLRFSYKYNVYLHVNISHTSEKEKIAFRCCCCCFCFTLTLAALQLLRLQWRIRSIYRCSLLSSKIYKACCISYDCYACM